ncbi:MAG: Gfo/Idh/MocA family oxidoreductase [Candidatus Latescibacterota bacterium]|nr:Gfo/Idh/MocA family oxidoreductase [Candidatus Latescibacterota bacterium]
MDSPPLRWGIIGCGDVCEAKSGPGLQKAQRSELVAVMRRRGDKAADYARRHGVMRWYDDADALIADPNVEAVYIATPPDSHLDYTRRAALAGKPVYVEKPMARTAEECRDMVASCRGNGVPLFVAYYRRQLPTFLKAEELLRDGAIGELRFVSLRLFGSASEADMTPGATPWRVQPEIAGKGGYFHDLGCHQLDLLDYLLGPIDDVSGYGLNQAGLYGCDDTVSASWRHASGVMGSGLWNFVAYEGSRMEAIDIVGTDGRLRTCAFDLERPLLLERAGAGPKPIHCPVPEHVQQPLIQTVVDAIADRGECPSTGDSALRTAEVMDRILTG